MFFLIFENYFIKFLDYYLSYFIFSILNYIFFRWVLDNRYNLIFNRTISLLLLPLIGCIFLIFIPSSILSNKKKYILSLIIAGSNLLLSLHILIGLDSCLMGRQYYNQIKLINLDIWKL